MRKTKTFKIEGNDASFEVKELRVKEIISLIQQDVLGSDLDLNTLKEVFAEKLLPLCGNMTLQDLIEMTPSEIQEIWDHFFEVNKAFFVMARKAGLQGILEKLKEAILSDFSKFVVDSSKQDT